MTVYTFVTEKEGAAIIEQVSGSDVNDAVLRWHRESETQPGPPLFEDGDAAPVNSVTNVWCISGHDPRGVFFIAHVVATLGD